MASAILPRLILRRARVLLNAPSLLGTAHTLNRRSPFPLKLHFQARGVASSVSGRPASQTPQHAATNIKEEVGNAASGLAKSIAGANLPVDHVKPANDTFVSYATLSPDFQFNKTSFSLELQVP